MKVRAEVDQLFNNGLYLNICNPDGRMLGVWKGMQDKRNILYTDMDDVWFMQFSNDETVQGFENAHPLLSRVWDSCKVDNNNR